MHIMLIRPAQVILTLLFVALPAGRFVLAAEAPQRPNIILAMADDQGWGDMAYNGDPLVKTPNFDAMAAAGLRFDRFYAAAPVCSPTRGSVLTGRHPNRFGVFKWGHAIRPQEITLAEALRTAGYTTGHFGKWHLGSVRKGSPVNPGASGFDVWLSAENFYDNDPVLSEMGRAVPVKGESSMIAVDRALEFIGKATAAKKPFLAVVWFGSPHSPHRAATEDAAHYADQPNAKQQFLGEVTGMDRAFGKLRDALGPLGIRENTILWYTSDNGALPVGSTGGHRGRKGSIYEGGLLVPAILEWPAVVRKPRTTNLRCNSSDIYPTLLDIVGITMPNQPPLDGVSLRPLIEGASQTERPPMGFWDFPAGGISTPSDAWMAELLKAQRAGGEPDNSARLKLDAGKITKHYPTDKFAGHAAWIDGDWKLHRTGKKKAGANNGPGGWELYNLASDSQEKQDVSASEPERVAAMQKALDAWQRSVVESLNGGDYASVE
jgi:arylsulfatase A-like enzyme